MENLSTIFCVCLQSVDVVVLLYFPSEIYVDPSIMNKGMNRTLLNDLLQRYAETINLVVGTFIPFLPPVKIRQDLFLELQPLESDQA